MSGGKISRGLNKPPGTPRRLLFLGQTQGQKQNRGKQLVIEAGICAIIQASSAVVAVESGSEAREGADVDA